MRTRIITGYTPDFEARAFALIASGADHGVTIEGIPYDVVHSDWLHNMRHRPRIILNELNAQELPVLWIDADSTILGPVDEALISQFERCCDFAGALVEDDAERNRTFRRMYRGMPQFWNYTPAALDMCQSFVNESEAPVDGDDESFLEMARRAAVVRGGVRLGVFPDEYCWVPGRHQMPPPKHVVILTRSSGLNPFAADGARRSGAWQS